MPVHQQGDVRVTIHPDTIEIQHPDHPTTWVNRADLAERFRTAVYVNASGRSMRILYRYRTAGPWEITIYPAEDGFFPEFSVRLASVSSAHGFTLMGRDLQAALPEFPWRLHEAPVAPFIDAVEG
jgi:hypothetical protein